MSQVVRRKNGVKTLARRLQDCHATNAGIVDNQTNDLTSRYEMEVKSRSCGVCGCG